MSMRVVVQARADMTVTSDADQSTAAGSLAVFPVLSAPMPAVMLPERVGLQSPSGRPGVAPFASGMAGAERLTGEPAGASRINRGSPHADAVHPCQQKV
jgi:hypothetical protein